MKSMDFCLQESGILQNFIADNIEIQHFKTENILKLSSLKES